MTGTNPEDRAVMIAVLRQVVGAVIDTVRVTHEQDGVGCPESILHNALEQRGLRVFDHRCKVVELAIATGKVRRSNHQLYWVS